MPNFPPRVLAALRSRPSGASFSTIVAETGIPPDAVAGTLGKLRRDGLVERRRGVWRMTAAAELDDEARLLDALAEQLLR